MLKDKKYLVFHISGGIGKNIAATAVTATIKKHYPSIKIIVTTAWEDVWVKNPDVFRVYNFSNMTYFYDDFIKNKEDEVFVLKHDPYDESNYILKKRSLIDTWGDMLGIEITEKPKIILSSKEIDMVRNMLPFSEKPIFVIHPNGGFLKMTNDTSAPVYSWPRDMNYHLAQNIINFMNSKGYFVIQIGTQQQNIYQNVTLFNSTIRNAMALLTLSSKRLLIDSFPQHASAALGLPSTVLWIANSPEQLGYDIHTNIVAKGEMREDATRKSYLEPFNIGATPDQYPYTDTNIFNIEEIIKTLIEDKN